MLTSYLSDLGKLDRVITVMKKVLTSPNEYGHSGATYLTTDMNAALSWKHKNEKEQDGKDTSINDKVFIIRYTELSLEDKLSYEGKEYDIINIEEVGRRRFLKIIGRWIA